MRAIANYNTSRASFYYSLDNKTYTKFGDDLNMKYDLTVFTGNKFAIFNYATVQTGGYVDVDWFSTEPEFDEAFYFDDSFEGYSEESLTLTELTINGKEELTLLTGSSSTITVKGIYADGSYGRYYHGGRL